MSRPRKSYPFSVGGQGPHPSLSQQMRQHPPGSSGGGSKGCAVALLAGLASAALIGAQARGWVA